MAYSTGSSPASVAVADLNGDGTPDLAVANQASNTVSVLRGNGNGTFQVRSDFTVGSQPSSVAAGEVNGDGRPDLVVSNFAAHTLSVLLNGNGTLQPAVQYPSGPQGGGPLGIAFGDLNGDARPDLAVVTSNGYYGVSVLLNDGASVAPCQSAVNYGAGSNPDAVLGTDFNGDGKLDLAIANRGSDDVSILLGTGLGTFLPRIDYVAGNGPTSLTAGDFNGDGKRDLAVANEFANPTDYEVSILLGNGDGTFQPPTNYPVGSSPRAVDIGDFNADGTADLVVANHDSDDLSLLIGIGDGSFQPAVGLPLGGHANAVAIGDFNRDGKQDLVVVLDSTSNALAVLLGGGNGTFQPSPSIPLPAASGNRSSSST